MREPIYSTGLLLIINFSVFQRFFNVLFFDLVLNSRLHRTASHRMGKTKRKYVATCYLDDLWSLPRHDLCAITVCSFGFFFFILLKKRFINNLSFVLLFVPFMNKREFTVIRLDQFSALRYHFEILSFDFWTLFLDATCSTVNPKCCDQNQVTEN